jgi:hypothetical protein
MGDFFWFVFFFAKENEQTPQSCQAVSFWLRGKFNPLFFLTGPVEPIRILHQRWRAYIETNFSIV